MKKFYTILLLLFFFIAKDSFSQPIFTYANWPTDGVTILSFELDPTGLNPGNGGSSQSWDFSTAVSTGNSSSSQAIDPALTPFSSSFPSANSAAISPGSLGSTGYVYFNANSSMVEMLGFVSDNGAGTINSLNYSDARRIVNFPFTFNSTLTDSYSAFSSYMVAGFQVDNYRIGNVTVTGDGYGSLVTPGGSYSNVLRISTVEYAKDSLLFMGNLTTQEAFITSYAWSDQSSIQSLFNITYDTIISNGTPSYFQSAQFATETTGVNEISAKPLEVYPNPAINTSVVHLRVDELNAGRTIFYATNLQGKNVKQIEFTLYPATNKTVDIDLSDCENGIYLIRLQQEDGSYTTKFVKQ